MKITDDYNAKYKPWARNPQVVPPLPVPKIPKFSSRKFNSYSEWNDWKQQLLAQIARENRKNG